MSTSFVLMLVGMLFTVTAEIIYPLVFSKQHVSKTLPEYYEGIREKDIAFPFVVRFMHYIAMGMYISAVILLFW